MEPVWLETSATGPASVMSVSHLTVCDYPTCSSKSSEINIVYVFLEDCGLNSTLMTFTFLIERLAHVSLRL